MFRVDNDSAVAIMPAATSAGTPGYFTDGNPATGQPATVLSAEFMNMVMMELANLVIDSGQTLAKSDYKQVSKAVQAMIANLSTVTWDKVTNKPTDWAVAGKTTLTGAATLSSTLTVAGVSTLNSTLTVAGATTLKTTLGVTGAVTLSSTLSVAGTATFAGAATVAGTLTFARGVVGGSMEIGSLTTANTPYLDFHSSGQNIDYDSRIIATGGDGTVGGGTLSLTASNISLTGDVAISGAASVANGLTIQVSGNSVASYAAQIFTSTSVTDGNRLLFTQGTTYGMAFGLAGSSNTTGTLRISGVNIATGEAIGVPLILGIDGSVSTGGNLSVAGNFSTAGTGTFAGSVRAAANVDLGYQATTAGQRTLSFYSGADTTRTAYVAVVGSAAASSTMTVQAGTVALTGAVTVSSTLGVTGAVTLSNSLAVTGAVTLASTLSVTGGVSLAGTLSAAGELQSTYANGLRLVNGNYGLIGRNYGGTFYLLPTASGDQYGTFNALRPFYINLATGLVGMGNGVSIAGGATTDTLTVAGVASVAGATTLSSTLAVTGAATLSSTLTVGTTAIVNGATTLKSTLAVTGTATFSGSISVAATATITTLVVNGNASIGGSLAVTGNVNTANLIAASTVYANAGNTWLAVDGNIYGSAWGGYLSTYIANAVSATAVGAATAALAADAVGSYAFLWTATSCGPGDNVAGASLTWGSYNYNSGVTVAGTWKCMGYITGGSKATVFRRVA